MTYLLLLLSIDFYTFEFIIWKTYYQMFHQTDLA